MSCNIKSKIFNKKKGELWETNLSLELFYETSINMEKWIIQPPTEQPFLQCYLIENFISIPTQLYLAEFKPDSMICIPVYSLKGFQHL